MDRYFAVIVFIVLLGSCGQSTDDKNVNIHDFELDEITVAELGKAYEKGQYTAEQVTQMYLDRIEMLNKTGPRLKRRYFD